MKDVMTITPLGAGQEVGRSCHLLEFRGVSILLDCGIHPGYDSIHGLPYLDRLEPDQIDLVLITHFHLDHAASLPYFTERTNFKGRIFMTHPTKAVLRLLLGDYLRLLAMRAGTKTSGDDTGQSEDVLYTETELQSCIDKIELIDYHQTVTLDIPVKKVIGANPTDSSETGDGGAPTSSGTIGVKFHALNAGHVLGAAMFVIDIGGRTVLYTGDYSAEEDRHLMAAELPTVTRGFLGNINPTESSSKSSSTVNIQQLEEEDDEDMIPASEMTSTNPDTDSDDMALDDSVMTSIPSMPFTADTTNSSMAHTGIIPQNSSTTTAPIVATEETLSILHPDVLIVESTYGVQVHASRAEREARFTSQVERIVTRGGNCLIPVFALGRAQELLLILDEYWQQHSHLQSVPIWYASKMASKALRVYQTYANMMNARIRAQMDIGNPFAFRYIRNLKSIDNIYQSADPNSSDLTVFDDRNSANVVFASPGMLQSGVSRRLFDRWASDPQNGVIVAGYAVEHTLAKEILNGPKEVVTLEGKRQPLNCLVDYVSFSAHVDFMQNRTFITKVCPKHIILVHGSKEEMGRLKGALMLQFRQWPENKRPTVTMPPNLQEVKLEFARRRSAKVIGSLAYNSFSSGRENAESKINLPQEGDSIQGILVTQNQSSKIVSPDDLATYTPLRVGSVSSTLHVPFVSAITSDGKNVYIDTFRFLLNEMFSGVVESTFPSSMYKGNDMNKSVPGIVEVEQDYDMGGRKDIARQGYSGIATSGSRVVVFSLLNQSVMVSIGKTMGIATVEWNASPLNDVVADAVVALLMHTQSSSSTIRATSQPCAHNQRRRRKRLDTKPLEPIDKVDSDLAPEATEEKRLKNKQSSVLRLCHEALLESYNNIDAVFEPSIATFEINLDGPSSSSNQSSARASGDTMIQSDATSLVCTVTVSFEHENSLDAKISVECSDSKFASAIQDCIRNIASSCVPISLPG